MAREAATSQVTFAFTQPRVLGMEDACAGLASSFRIQAAPLISVSGFYWSPRCSPQCQVSTIPIVRSHLLCSCPIRSAPRLSLPPPHLYHLLSKWQSLPAPPVY